MFGRKKADTTQAATAKPKIEPPINLAANGAATNAIEPRPLGASVESDGDALTLRRLTAFAQIVTLLMRSPAHKHLSLADLEWLVFPPLMTGQFSLVQAKSRDGKTSFPAAVAMWASVSAEVDKRLSANLDAPVRLRPDEWKSGDILWLTEVVGDRRVVPGLLKQLSEQAFKGKDVKVRSRGGEGKIIVQSLRTAIASQASSAAA